MRTKLQFDHVGLITDQKKEGELWVEKTRVWVTDCKKHPYRIEWLRFEPDSPATGPVRGKSHIAFRVSDIKEASRGLKVLLEPFDSGYDIVGFYQSKDGAVIEFMKEKR